MHDVFEVKIQDHVTHDFVHHKQAAGQGDRPVEDGHREGLVERYFPCGRNDGGQQSTDIAVICTRVSE